VLLAWTAATIVEPIVKTLREVGISRGLASIGVTLLVLLVIGILLFVLSAPLVYWLGRASYIGALLREKDCFPAGAAKGALGHWLGMVRS